MYDNIVTQGISAQKELYGPAGDQIIDEYSRLKKLGKTEKEIKAGMETKINEVGPTTVSKHCCDPLSHSIFDIAPSSIPSSDKKKLVESLKKAKLRGEVSKFFVPPSDPAYHIEVVL